jgi:DNA-binding transcriptional ArsR family regulator
MRAEAAPPPITNIKDPRWARAIAHPLRARLLAILEEGPASPVTLAGKLGESLGTVAYHVRQLYELGLLDLVSTRQRRGATEHYYRAREHPRISDSAWSELGVVAKQRIITASLARIHEYAMRSAAAGGFDARDSHFTRTPLRLDAKGWTELARATKAWLAQTDKIEKEARARLRSDPHDAIDVGLVILLFEALPFGAEPPSPPRARRQPEPERAAAQPARPPQKPRARRATTKR